MSSSEFKVISDFRLLSTREGGASAIPAPRRNQTLKIARDSCQRSGAPPPTRHEIAPLFARRPSAFLARSATFCLFRARDSRLQDTIPAGNTINPADSIEP